MTEDEWGVGEDLAGSSSKRPGKMFVLTGLNWSLTIIFQGAMFVLSTRRWKTGKTILKIKALVAKKGYLYPLFLFIMSQDLLKRPEEALQICNGLQKSLDQALISLESQDYEAEEE